MRLFLFAAMLVAQFLAYADELGQPLAPVFTVALSTGGRVPVQLGQSLPPMIAPTTTPAGAGHWVDAIATAYSPEDPIDGAYRATKGRWRYITADGSTDIRDEPYGVAVPKVNGRPLWAYGTEVVIPRGLGYVEHAHPDRTFTVDDTGSTITRATSQTGDVHIDLRFRSEASARAWAGPTGHRRIRIWVCE